MTYEQILEKTRKSLKNVSVETDKEHIALEFDIYGEGEGAFYAETKDGKIAVEPYEYYDRDAKLIITAQELEAILSGKKTLRESIDDGILMLEGNFEAAEKLLGAVKKPVKKQTAKKTAEKKSTAKKQTAKKETAKKEAKKVTKAEKDIVDMTKKEKSTIAKDIKK